MFLFLIYYHIKWKINFYIIHRIGKEDFREKTQQTATQLRDTQNDAAFKEIEKFGDVFDFQEIKKLFAKMDLLPAE
jgi:hypothetical protein